VLCSDGPVTSLVELTLTVEHRRGHGAIYDAVNHGWLDFAACAGCWPPRPLPRAADGRIVLSVDVSNWLRPDAPTIPELLFRHVYGRGRSADQFIPGWLYSFVAAFGQRLHLLDRAAGRDPARAGGTLLARSEAMIHLAMTDLIARRLTGEATISWRDPTPRNQTPIPGGNIGRKRPLIACF
jgi:DDE superfamily endonuclease